MAISPALMKAILAMDSYNRGYNSGIDFNTYQPDGVTVRVASDKVGTQIGLATVYNNSSFVFNNTDKSIGFYGIAYSYAGQTTIAYRGTDEDIIAFPLNNDVVHGFPVGADNVNVKQALMAFQF